MGNESLERELEQLREQNRRLRVEMIDRLRELADAERRQRESEKRHEEDKKRHEEEQKRHEEEQKKALKEKRRLEKEIDDLKAELARARRSSENSSKRPSSDIVKPKRERRKSARKIGGQPGHKRHDREPFSDADIDRWINYDATRCPYCGGPLYLCQQRAPEVIQQVDVAGKLLEKTSHTAPWFECANCKTQHCPMPEEVKKGGLFGPVLTAWIAYLKGGCHASFSTIRKFVRDVLNLSISRGFLAKIIAKVSAALTGTWEELRMLLPLAQVLNVDETSHKENGRRMQTWCYRAGNFVLFKIAETRSTAEILEMLGADFDGVIGCDHFSSYRCYMNEFGGELQFCLSHLIRDVKFLLDLPDAATRDYGTRFLDRLRALFNVIHRRESMTKAAFRDELEAQRCAILSTATRNVPDSREALNLAKRMEQYGESYFRFITTPGVEPTNNLAEQAIRFVVIDRHVTQGTRSEVGRHWCERIWTVLGTCAQNGVSAFHTIRDAVVAFFKGTPAPRILVGSS